ncbi:MAG: putative folate metabolism gamma-glutamate ligase [Candidatus Pacebacteria bacterium]|nr:putative folate metabolism gamma-glutamate ligase [Candidatus Paceibacterota bacterium]
MDLSERETMNCAAYSTPIVRPNDDLLQLIFAAIPQLSERSVLCITSKIVALCEGAVVPIKFGTREEKHALVAQDAEHYLPPDKSKYDLMLTIKHQTLAVNAGIDESNVSGVYALLPRDPNKTAATVWQALRKQYGLQEVGVVITDSKSIPVKWGAIGTAIGHCGFVALNSHIGEPDLFGRKLQITQVNVAESLAAVGTYVMGESAERQPLAVIQAAPRVVFQDRPPTVSEIAELVIALEDDVYAPLLQAVNWQQHASHKHQK